MEKLRLLIICSACILAVGCVGPTGDPPPYPQPSFEYTYIEDGNATVLNITFIDTGGVSNHSIRILVDDTLAYANGSFNGSYTASEAYKNDWRGGIMDGDTLMLTNSGQFPPGADIEIQIQDTNEFVTVGKDQAPPYEVTETELSISDRTETSTLPHPLNTLTRRGQQNNR